MPSEKVERDLLLAANPLTDVLRRYGHMLKKNGAEFVTLCPFHNDHSPSMRVNPDKGVWFCDPCATGGSVVDYVMKRDGLDVVQAMKKLEEWGGLDKPTPTKPTAVGSMQVVAEYEYTDEEGNLLYQVVRLHQPDASRPGGFKKTFRQRRKTAAGWEWGLGDTRRVLYRLVEVLNNRDVFVVEGEKCADALCELGFCATTNAMGAGKWESEYTESLRGRNVVILPDNDTAGREHAERVAAEIYPAVASLKLVKLPDMPEKGDIVEFIATFEDKEQAAQTLVNLVRQQLAWRPNGAVREDADLQSKIGRAHV